MNDLKKSERSISVLLLVLCGFWLVLTFQVPDSTMPGAPGPRFFPLCVLGILAGLSLLLLYFSSRKAPKPGIEAPAASAKETDEGCKDPGEDSVPDRKLVVFSFALIFLYVIGIDVVGFYGATFVAVFLSLRVAMQIRNWLHATASALVITGSVYAVFTLLFQLPLPHGSLW